MTISQVQDRLRYFSETDFTFDEGPHIYRLRGKIIPSATGFLKQFKKPFLATPEKTLGTQRRLGLTHEQVVALWDHDRDYAGILGHKVHSYIEHWLMGLNPLPYCPQDPEVAKRVAKFHQIYERRLKGFQLVGQEIRMFHDQAQLAGTLDFLGMYNGELWVGDYKTSKKVLTDVDQHYDMLLGPFTDEKENELNVYSIQISLYRLFLEAIGISTAGGFIVHLPGVHYKTKKDQEPRILKAKDYRARLRPVLGMCV